ncbi:eukaryotic translation initiation factor 3 subunit J [Neocloeon triangulifer]|uniref:eukaryotic translation initiation factor 3 subunit J n=1 Tax=Neocloeon triangulifer TaxID=2078957 RepID=UPI00286F114A|nr:eukaryotic translation initiation factor 3 subunit J [Neocloeon triangulifer]
MEEDWDADGFEPKEVTVKAAGKWDDEDLDDDVKDNWEDDEEEEKKDTEKQEEKSSIAPAPAKKNKKSLSKKIEEKERSEQLAMESKKPMTPEERLAEKKRQQKLQEEADLRAAIETFGITEGSGSGIDAMLPSSKEEFDEFGKALVKKIIPFSSSQHFPLFVEELIRDVCANLTSNDLKKLKNTIDNLHLEKTKIEKGDKAKKKGGKGKAKLRVEGESAIVDEYSAYDVEEFDDFI